jgi:DNA-directed RNA polymerase II subunit RPB1
VFSDYNMDNLIFRLRLNPFNKTKKRGGVAGSDRRDLSVEEFSGHVAKQYRIARRVGISNVSARKIQNAVSKRTEVCHRGHLDSGHDRSNLMDILAMDYIDYKRTVSNDIREVFNVLGIEAARQVIFDEFSEVMEFSDVHKLPPFESALRQNDVQPEPGFYIPFWAD